MSEETAAQKITPLQRCVSQARLALVTAGAEFKTNYLLQDAAVLNVIRACETAIDLANMVIRKKHLGIPAESRDSFGILVRESILDHELGAKLQKMVGFRQGSAAPVEVIILFCGWSLRVTNAVTPGWIRSLAPRLFGRRVDINGRCSRRWRCDTAVDERTD